MNDDNNIQNELKELSSLLAEMPRSMPFAVPEGYFIQLPEHAVATVMAGDNALTVKHDAPYKIPQGYFDQLPELVLTAVKKKEEKEIKRQIYVPRVQWLTAAMLAMVISLGGYIMFVQGTRHNSEKMLASVPSKEINEYVQTKYGLDATKILNENKIQDLKVDSKDIEAYLNDTGWE